MDVLSPELMWIGDRCYRVNSQCLKDESIRPGETGTYVEQDLYGDEKETDNEDESDIEDEYKIEMISDGRFCTTFHVPQIFYGQIVGKRGAIKTRIEAETNTQIQVPRPGAPPEIEIFGSKRRDVSSARRKVEMISIASRRKQQFTHFMCVPFNSPEIKENFIKFKNEILSGPPVVGLDESLFQRPHKLHLTMGILSLMDNEDRALAAQYLQDCEERIIKPAIQKYGSIEIILSGINIMNDDFTSVHVLYGRVESEGLQSISNGIQEYFDSKNLLTDKTGKMHVTLINSIYRDDDAEIQNAGDKARYRIRFKKRAFFDGRSIMEKYKNFYFGKQKLQEIHLSLSHSPSSDGFYEATAILKIDL